MEANTEQRRIQAESNVRMWTWERNVWLNNKETPHAPPTDTGIWDHLIPAQCVNQIINTHAQIHVTCPHSHLPRWIHTHKHRAEFYQIKFKTKKHVFHLCGNSVFLSFNHLFQICSNGSVRDSAGSRSSKTVSVLSGHWTINRFHFNTTRFSNAKLQNAPDYKC